MSGRHTAFANTTATLALLILVHSTEAPAAERFAATLKVDGEEVELQHAEVQELPGLIYVVVGDRSLADSEGDPMRVDGYRGIHIALSETGEAWEYGVGRIYHDGLREKPYRIPEEATLRVERVGDYGYVGSLTLEEYTIPHREVKLAFDVAFEFELADPCAPAEISGDRSAPAQAFAKLYQDYAQCRFTEVASSLVPALAGPWQANLEERREQAIDELMRYQKLVPKVLDIAATSSAEAEAVLAVTLTGELATTSEEIVMKKVDGEWKLSSGLVF
jgi:hypothetical protein